MLKDTSFWAMHRLGDMRVASRYGTYILRYYKNLKVYVGSFHQWFFG